MTNHPGNTALERLLSQFEDLFPGSFNLDTLLAAEPETPATPQRIPPPAQNDPFLNWDDFSPRMLAEIEEVTKNALPGGDTGASALTTASHTGTPSPAATGEATGAAADISAAPLELGLEAGWLADLFQFFADVRDWIEGGREGAFEGLLLPSIQRGEWAAAPQHAAEPDNDTFDFAGLADLTDLSLPGGVFDEWRGPTADNPGTAAEDLPITPVAEPVISDWFFG